MAQVLTAALKNESKVTDPAKSLAVLKYQATATCVAMHGPRVDRTFVSTYGAAKTATLNQLLPGGNADALDATHVHIGGFYVCRGVHGGLAACVKRLKARGIKVSMDPNFDATGEWTPPAMMTAVRGPAAVDVLMPSEVEACEITGKDTAEEALEVLVGGANTGRKRIGESSSDGVGLVVIKRGARGGSSRGTRPAGGGRCPRARCLGWWTPTARATPSTRGSCASGRRGWTSALRSWLGAPPPPCAAQHSGAVGAWAPDRKIVDAQSEAEYGDKPWWQKGILACMAPRRPV